MSTRDVQMTEIQARVLGGLDQKVAAALRERDLALTMVLAGHGIEKAEVISIDLDKHTIQLAEQDPKPKAD